MPLRLQALLIAFLILALLIGLPVANAEADIESRIGASVNWIAAREVSIPGPSGVSVLGFARGSDAPSNSTIFVEDQALIALALSAYHYTHNVGEYDSLVDLAANFTVSALTPDGDFYEYYDLRDHQWHNSGGLYPWDAYAIGGLAFAAYWSAAEVSRPSPFWFGVESRLKQSMVFFLDYQRNTGSWLFRQKGTTVREALTRENAVLLAGLLYLGLFEHYWGSKQQAAFYAALAQRTAKWLFALQVRDPSLSTYGGFPHSDVNATQVSEENGEIIFGINSYHAVAGALLSDPSPTLTDTRQSMVYWVRGFVEKMLDSYGGLYNARSTHGIIKYPQTTRAAALALQALTEIWIDLGDPIYKAYSQQFYNWTVGSNSAGRDLQDPSGGFYTSINGTTVDMSLRTDVTASVLYAYVRTGFIRIPEFPAGLEALLLLAALVGVVAVKRKSESRMPST